MMTLDPIGTVLQIATIGCSLVSTKLLTKKATERWGYLIMLLSLPVWMALEVYYAEWVYFFLNPVYIYLYYKAFKEHWKETEMPLTRKGKKIMAVMANEYGSGKGKEVFYASQNKGTIKGTHKKSHYQRSK
jgi:hypothetical protein